ncbi:vascular cell adhesion protein 1-like isoform X2 [Dendrobates tinctorius]|uniref:vascular cell adhesion protein 1-like isoform X2 n=1 Tax=Dendrobates tinctorius TaxID=92724 RepID=UPI003CC97779
MFVPLGEWIVLNCTFTCPNKPNWETRLQKRNHQSELNWASVEVLVDDWEKSELVCLQSLIDGSEKYDVTVVMAYGPPDVPVVTITPGPNIQEGDFFNITCKSDGSPKPEYDWMVPTGADVIYTQNKSVVSVAKAGQVHNGVYTCEAKNVHGLVNGSMSVQVTTKGRPHKHVGVIVSSLLVFTITTFILWKTITRRSSSRDSE